MQCVCRDDRLPNGFEERFLFSPERPYSITIKQFPTEDVVPMHYAETIEILLCQDLQGEIVIDSHHYTLSGRQVFVIPPVTVHSNNVRPGMGMMYVLKISFPDMANYLNLHNILSLSGCQMNQLKYLCPAYDTVEGIVKGLVTHDGDMPRCLALILALFVTLSHHVDRDRGNTPVNARFQESSLQDLIRWTHENYARKITIDEVANLTGYSKYHFCSQFKAQTGMSYMRYLNSVRMEHACLMLRNGESVQTVCHNVGFENVSHFIQVFKSIRHMTPRQYASQEGKSEAQGVTGEESRE